MADLYLEIDGGPLPVEDHRDDEGKPGQCHMVVSYRTAEALQERLEEGGELKGALMQELREQGVPVDSRHSALRIVQATPNQSYYNGGAVDAPGGGELVAWYQEHGQAPVAGSDTPEEPGSSKGSRGTTPSKGSRKKKK